MLDGNTTETEGDSEDPDERAFDEFMSRKTVKQGEYKMQDYLKKLLTRYTQTYLSSQERRLLAGVW